MNKTHWKNVIDSKYLGAYSFDAVPGVEEVILTIKEVKVEEVKGEGGKTDVLPVVYFEETNEKGIMVKPMVFNKTNCKVMEDMYTPFLEDWVGKRIEIYVTETKLKRDLVPCLRVRNKIIAPIDYHCSICGKEVVKEQYNAIIAKYGVLVCSKECVEKLKEKQNNEESKGE